MTKQDGYDYIVVGAGSAGCAVAVRLSDDPSCRVLLLEAGGSDRSMLYTKPGFVSILHTVPQIKPKYDWGFKSQPQKHALDRVISSTRGKLLGGSSSINGMLYVRGNQQNYDDWAADGCEGWSFQEVLPAFKRLEDWEGEAGELRGKGGPIQVSRPEADKMSPASLAFLDAVSGACGVPVLDDYNGESQEGVARVQMSCRNGVRYSTSEGYLQPNLGRKNLTILTGALTHRVLLEGSRAVGVRYEVQGEVIDVRADREVVLCGGAFGSPQILLRSGIGPAAHLAELGVDVVADLPVGHNLQDHLFFPLTFLAPNAGHKGNAMHFAAGILKETLFGGTWFGRSVFETIAFLKTDPGQRIPNLQLHCLPWAYPANQDDSTKIPTVDPRAALTVQPTLIYPKSRGSFRLTSADPHAKPFIDPGYLTEAVDTDLLLQGVEITRAILAHPAFKAEIKAELEPGPDFSADKLRAEVKWRASTVYHPVGTCRMGSDERAVVTPDLRVKGIEGLRVADASIFPSLTGGNTNIPSIMVGERAAELIRG